MKLDPDAIQRRRHTRAIVFAGGAVAVLAVAWAWTDSGGPATPLLALPIVRLGHCWPAARAAGRFCRRLASWPVLSATLVGALALTSSAAISLLIRMPQPAVHDEFSYLLAADTFAHGRLTNPTHPMWVHFESPHIIQQPSYASPYPPAQGIAIAIGQVALGRPIAGVWLSAGLACGALTWMLAGWMPARWALAGGLLAAVHPLTIGWSQNYWGGLMAMLGGGLMLGGFRRIVRRPRGRHAVVFGVGVAILANSRPYEGLVLSVPFAVALGIWLASRRGPPARIAFKRVLLPFAGVLAVVGSGMLYYNYRVTGDPLTPPHLHQNRTYGVEPIFVFQDPRPMPTYRHDKLRKFYGAWEGGRPERTFSGLAATVLTRAKQHAWHHFTSFFLVAAVAILLPLERNGWQHLAILGLGVFAVGLGAPSWTFPHYAAPASGLVLLVTLRAMRGVGIWRFGRLRLGQPLVQAVWLFMLGTLAVASWHMVRSSSGEGGWQYERARIAASLSRSGAKHLVIVRYVPEHDPGVEWVYNGADIDGAPVVWAQDMDPRANATLLDYFKDRSVWLLEPDRAFTPVPLRVPSPSRQSLDDRDHRTSPSNWVERG